jgi:threonine dehydrogenase-like Zn-dependent dehydrogenase
VRALVFDGSVARVVDVREPEPLPGEAVVRVALAGVCNTDLEIVRGYMGFRGTLGHELVGVVEAHPDPSWVGARVTAEINLACGACPLCARGLGRHCPTRTVLGILDKDGCFAEKVTLPAANLHRVPDGVPDGAAVFAEPLAAAFEIVEQVHVDPSARVLVLGDGKLGLLCALVLAEGCADVTLAGRHEAKLAHARARGVRATNVEALASQKFDVVVEATGHAEGLALALSRVRPRGTIVLKSTFAGAPTVDTAKLVIDEIHLVGSRCGPFSPALRALATKRIDPTPLVSDTFSLADGVLALERARTPGVLKVLIRP